jgi:3-oxoacyl-[acyl-carrier protein] reductase
MDLGLDGLRALVGGGSRGLGAAIGLALAGEGVRVALVARESGDLHAHADAIGGIAVPGDLGDAQGPQQVLAQVTAALGGLDLLVVNSGGPPSGSFLALSDASWHTAVEGTLMGSVRLIRDALPILRASVAPAILVILSSSVREPIPGLVTSNVLRPGLAGLIKSLVGEIAPIRMNGLAPGRIATGRVARLDLERARAQGITEDEIRRRTNERIPLGRYGAPEEVGRVAAFLMSNAASYVNGAIVTVDGGMSRSLP